MYETYVPITETTVERKPPTIADIVRERTDNGTRIVDFFLDLMEGRVDDARLCHRIDAAKQLVKYGSKKAADFIAQHGDETCDHCESRKRGPRPRRDATPVAGPPFAAPHLTPDFLTLLTEDFFTVLTAVDEDLMVKLVRGQTRYGDSIVEFLDAVMQGREDGFKPHHRIAAAKELISHILRDEHRSHTPGVPDHKIVVPAQAAPAPSTAEEAKIVRPEPIEEPALSLPNRQCSGDSAVPGPAANEADPTVVPAKAGTQRGGDGRSQHADEPAQVEIPYKCLLPKQSVAGTHLRPHQAGAGRGSNRRKDENPPPAELVPAGRRIKEKLVAHRHEPDPWDGPIVSTHPGRSPPG